MNIAHFVYPFVSWCTLGLFPEYLAVINNAAVNVHVQVLAWTGFQNGITES